MSERDTLLIVDDMEINRAILNNIFEQDYNILEAENGSQALMLMEQYHSNLAAVLLDVTMPVKDGFQVLADMKRSRLLNELPVIIITAEDSPENEVRSFDLGASDIIVKPFETYVVTRRVQNAIELNQHRLHLEELVEKQALRIRESNDVIIDTLSSIIEHRSLESGRHILRIRMFTKILLENVQYYHPEYDLSEQTISIIASASSMHDVGKIAIPDAILNKPGPLTKDEFEIMKTHSTKGCEILTGLERMGDKEYLTYAYNICRYHHERWDGKGYPDGLKGDNIPICAQVVGIADAYEALTTDRVYKRAYDPQRAFNMILNGDCGAFSPKLLECFKNVRDQFSQLTMEYADGRQPETDTVSPLPQSSMIHLESRPLSQLGQMKYLALLRYTKATVMEADLDTGVYHLVYMPNSRDFEPLRTGSCFEESIRHFAESSVHPQDREAVLRLLGDYSKEFFNEGLLMRSRKYRIINHMTGKYVWYNATILRIDTDDPSQHKVLIVWDCADDSASVPSASAETIRDPDFLNSMVTFYQSRNDKWFTLTYTNEGFTSLLGFSKQEIQEKFRNCLMEMIHHEDRLHVVKQVKDQIKNGLNVELEYRLQTKEGNYLWVVEKSHLATGIDGQEYFNCLLMDVTHSKEQQEELRLMLERYKIIIDQTNDIVFEWDIESDKLVYSSNWEKRFGYSPILELESHKIPFVSHLHPEDIPKFNAMTDQALRGTPYWETDLRIAKSDGHYLWCKVRAAAQYDSSRRPIRAVGVILDIDSAKREAEALRAKAERDSLTKLYNKGAARQKIEHYLEQRKPEDTAAMYIIDVDNFKLVNDKFGHMFGDAVLAKTALQIQNLFRAEDIISRIGGDEFMVFIKHTDDTQIINKRAQSIIDTFGLLLKEYLDEVPLSCSIGISKCPQDGEDFQNLFQKCDLALYKAKSQGKNQYVVFDPSTMDRLFPGSDSQEIAAGTRIDSNDAPEANILVQQAFQTLYKSEDVENSVNSILGIIGQQFDVSRVYIFENSGDGSYCTNTFEWCNTGITPEKTRLQTVLYSDLGNNYHENFDENGIFYCPDITTLSKEQYNILAPQKIKSMLQCAIRNNGKFAGFIGFDDCALQRMWTQEQIDTLSYVSELLSTFLLKKRAQDHAQETAQDLCMILDNQNSWIYVIDPDTYALHYINEKTHLIAPDAKLGMCCYDAFFNRSKPCLQCPAKDIRKNVNCTMEVYNPVLKVWSLADASFIRWRGRDACLLSCHDITPYKS